MTKIPNKQLIEIASWRIVSELYRRYPGRFKVIETHPGGGLYDCLTLVDGRTQIADFNRQGRLHVFNRFDGNRRLIPPFDLWNKMIESVDLKDLLDNISKMMGLPIPTSSLPSSTNTTLVYRFISSFLTHATFGKNKWECRNGCRDTSGYGGGVSKDFDMFVGAQKQIREIFPDDILGQPAYRFWFLRKNDVPVLCLETSGLVWLKEEKPYKLMELYQKNRRIWPIINKLADHLFE